MACSTLPQFLTFPHVNKSLPNSAVMDLTMAFIFSEKYHVVTDGLRPSL